MKIVSLILMITVCLLAHAQQYNSKFIPDSLKQNADVITRLDELVCEIKSPGRAVEHEHHIYTILNESGDFMANYRSSYDKFTSINSISATLYDANGKEVRHLKKKDMQDVSGTDGESLMTDRRYKIAPMYNRTYPYTVDFEEEDEMNSIFFLHDWFPQGLNRTAVEHDRYVIIAPKDYVLRYKAVNGALLPVITEKDGKKTYTWEISNLPAKTEEPISPSWSSLVPYVMVEPSDFEREGYKGNMSTWRDFGMFMYELLKGRDVLPADLKKKVHDLTDELKSPKEKVVVLYDYLQKNTRYISIQLGIGGFQPFDASYVATKKYGDCKALSNFMVALLKEAGIKGHSVIIEAGEEYAGGMDTSFTHDPFNHVICCVPLKKDTIWLECTSETLPAGYLSGFTANRYGMLLDESGGKLVHTPKYGMRDNLQSHKITATLTLEGNLSLTSIGRYTALQQDRLELIINNYSKDRVMEYLKKEIDLPTYDVATYNYKQEKNILPPAIDESLEITASNYAQVSGKRIFINPNILTRSYSRLKQDDDRKYDIELKEESAETDTVEIKIPAGYQPEAIPKDQKIENKFGRYTCSIKVASDKIVYYRYREYYSGRFPAKDYQDLLKYYEQVYKADRSKVVLLKND